MNKVILNSKSVMGILGILCVSAFMATPAHAVTGTVISEIGLNIREEPRGKVLGALPIGSTFEVVSRQGKWLHVKLNDGRMVYVWNPANVNVVGAEKIADGVSVAPVTPVERQPLPDVRAGEPASRDVTVVPQPAPRDDARTGARDVARDVAVPGSDVASPVPLPVPRPFFEKGKTFTVSGNYRLRAGPNVNDRAITTLTAGRSQVTVLERDGEWMKVRTKDGKQGWVHGAGLTEASACIDGRCGERRNGARDDAADILDATRNQARSSGSGIACVRNEILKSAKSVVRRLFGNRPRSKGVCALGVRKILDHAGVNNGAGLGHAVDYHSKGVLQRKGFVNKIGTYNAFNAPPGAILVFKGPNTASYLRTGRMARPYGNYVGHVTVKGDDGRYYTDGRTADPAIANRTLVGVYVPEDMSRMPASIRRKCQ